MDKLNKKFLCSTGTLVRRTNGYNYPRALRIIGELLGEGAVSGGELMMLTHYYDKFDEVTSAVNASGVPFPVIHCEKGVGTDLSCAAAMDADGDYISATAMLLALQSDFRLNCRFGEKIGAKYMVFHLWSGFDSDTNIDYNIENAKEFSDIANEYGLRLLFETIPCTTHDPISNLSALLDTFPEAEFIYDTRLSALHGQEIEFLRNEKLTSRMRHMHVSDFIGALRDFSALRPIYHPYEGQIDFDSIAAELHRIGYNGMITLESPACAEDETDKAKLLETFTLLSRVF